MSSYTLKEGMCMAIESISGVNSYSHMAVGAVSFSKSGLKTETIRKLKALGIDPASVKTEAEAQNRIAEAERQKKVEQNLSVQPHQSASSIDMKQLHDDIKSLGDKLGINVQTINDLDKIADTLKLGVDEFVKGASAQTNISDKATVKLGNGTEVKEDPKKIQSDYQDIKERIDEAKTAKNSMFAGQDMLAMMNKYALGIS